MFDQIEIGLQTGDAQQTNRLLLADSFTYVLAHRYNLRVTNILLETLIDVLQKLFHCASVFVFSQEIRLYLRTVEDTKSVVERIVIAVERNLLNSFRTFSLNGVAGCAFCLSLISLHEELLCNLFGHHRRVAVKRVNHSLEIQFLIERPCCVISQTVFLKTFDRSAELTTSLCDVA